ncbi:Spx/MgsR family RNA polymerase-binding regulatory protein [Enterococcus villorum]|uniref:Spx/MgsR family RNA polymerase-binding regulatory protein n=1 Tax=Enterococcus villorum TaxID=112904 RepID=UPI003F8ABFD8
MKIYGSAHCLTCLKAKQWLEEKQLSYQFIDLDQRDLTAKEAKELCGFAEVQAEQLFATWSQGFKKLEIDLSTITKQQLIVLCRTHGDLIRRPLIIIDDVLFVGFNEPLMEKLIVSRE